MQIESFRVLKYRNIQDSSPINLNSLTCIVGKNQSGKTALLKALHKFNPYRPEPYDIRREWPRGERRQRNPKQPVCQVHFSLDKQEREELALITAQEMTARVMVTKDYEGSFEVQFPDHPDLFPNQLHPNKIDEWSDGLPRTEETMSEGFLRVAHQCLEEARRLAREGRYTELFSLQASHEEKFRSVPSVAGPRGEEEKRLLKAYLSHWSVIKNKSPQRLSVQEQAHEYIVSRIPTFIYMDDYQEFHGTAFLDQVFARLKDGQITPDDETFLMLIKLSQLDLDQLVNQSQSRDETITRERQYDLDDAARTLTKEISGRWKQTPYRIHFRADGQKFFTEIEAEGKEIGMIPLEEESKGFRWFFSFDLKFMHDSQGTFAGCVLLLDEPGLHLHPGGQQDLLERLDAYAENNALVYTTHLPFLIDLREPTRIRVITDTEKGAVVSQDFNASTPEEKKTLQAALGMQISQNYRGAQKNLIIESIEDFTLLMVLSNLFERFNLKGLSPEMRVTAAGTAQQMLYLSSFMMGEGLEVVALFNSVKEGRLEEERLREKWLTHYPEAQASTLLLSEAVGLKRNVDFTMEDLFGEKYYLRKLEESHKDKILKAEVSKISLPSGQGICQRATKACQKADIEFERATVVQCIKQELLKMVNVYELELKTKERAEQLFQAIRDKISS